MMVKIKVNDREIEVEPTATLLEACLQAGVDVPYMCYHPGMKVVAVCRICQVEVKGMAKLQTACSTPVREGMEVFTETAQARKARQGTVEFWLVNHPLDCPICDKAGECPLQDVTYNLRGGGSRLRDPKVNRPKRKVLGDHIVFDAERCILCWRCTRFTQDISGSNQLMLVNRGVKTEIDTPHGVQLNDPFSGNVADVCPVGALTTREFRFKSRPWEMTAQETTCTACPVGCSATLWSKKGVLQRMTARPNPQVNDYWLCDRGRFDLKFVNDPSRLRKPVLATQRSGGGSGGAGSPAVASDGSVSWDEAAHEMARIVSGAGGAKPKGWAVIAGPHATNEEYFALQRFARETLKTHDLVFDNGPGGPELTETRVDWLKSPRLLGAVADLDRADVILQIGGNLELTHPVYSLRIRKAVRDQGAKLYLGTTAPGGLDQEALLRVSLNEGEEEAYLGRLTGGAGDDPVRWVRDAVTTAKSGVLILNAGVRNDALLPAVRTLLNLNGLGMKLLLLDAAPNQVGAWDLGFAPGYAPGYRPVDAPRGSRSAVLKALTEGTTDGVILYNSGRPWTYSPDVAAAVGHAKTRVVFDILPQPLGEGAVLTIPSPSMAEVDGTMTTADHRIVLLRRSVPGPEGLWHPAAFLARVEKLAGGPQRSGAPVDVFRDLSRAGAGYAELNFGLLRPEGRPWRPAWAAAGAGVGSSPKEG